MRSGWLLIFPVLLGLGPAGCALPYYTQAVRGQAGLATEPNGVPEPLRQGILRLVAHLFTTRDGSGGEPPAAVGALWRPYRKMRLA